MTVIGVDFNSPEGASGVKVENEKLIASIAHDERVGGEVLCAARAVEMMSGCRSRAVKQVHEIPLFVSPYLFDGAMCYFFDCSKKSNTVQPL